MQPSFPVGVTPKMQFRLEELTAMVEAASSSQLTGNDRCEIKKQIQNLQALMDHSEQGPEPEPGEAGQMASRVNFLEKELTKAQDMLRDAKKHITQVDKMTSLGTLVAGIAHELKNPLNYVNNLAILSNDLLVELKEALATETTIDKSHVQEVIEDLELNSQSITEHGERAARIIQDIMDVAGGKPGEYHQTHLNTLVDDFANMAYHGARFNKNIKVRLEKEFDPNVGDLNTIPQSLGRVMINLINNAVDAVSNYRQNDAHFLPIIKISTHSHPNEILLKIQDNGPGISQSEIEKIFKPFYSTKSHTRSNMGLGLSISKDIVAGELGGKLSVESKEGSYTVFTIHLPTESEKTTV